ncbi:MAG: ATP synthase subunit C [Sphaerochaetaceae bacterium]|nr:ATP synthase subunit C [Sphaerochaetaceae bacterium]
MTIYTFKRNIALSLLFTLIILIATAFVATPTLHAASEAVVEDVKNESINAPLICFAAAIAFAFGAIGAAMAISKVGAAAMGAISERPEIASNALIFVALAEGLVVFGFITALMILGKV